ncbi:AAA family ATPase [Clostridium tepidum]|uniref:AAA family ATPase n=1 Tax=Clostridium tepidum TaxID=1962263 RepID=A0A1S9I2U9_9CLOT|nr:ATP-binding protein [Clostridium tepidum]OOO64654.1 AAA family ATPase [Clostridium tepidum]
MKEVMIPNGSIAVEAKYTEQVISDYRRNPLIEALPNLLSPNEVIKKIAVYPEYYRSERQVESYYRIHMIDRLFQVFQPLPMNLELENKISRALRQGYISRNPFGNKLAQGFYKDYYSKNSKGFINKDGFNSSSLGFTLIGISGIGKTSSLQRILNLYPNIIVHSEYKSIPFSMYQVVYLKLECPHDGSIKGLLYEFFAEIDRLLGTNYYEKVMRAKSTVDAMMTIMNQVVRNCALGILVIDEMQHLSSAKSGGSEKMLNFFVNLVNNVGVPVVLVGTPKAINVLQGDFRQARRGSGSGGDMVCDRIQKDEVWGLLVNSIWHYQWTRKETPLTPEISNVLYEETQGVPDLLKKVYAIAQAHAISTGKEEITPQIIRKVAKENLKLIQPMITALKTNNIREIAKFDDINLMEIDFKDTLTRTKESIKLDLKAKEMMNKGKKIKQDNSNEEKKESNSVNARSEVNTVHANKVVNELGGRKSRDTKDEFNKEDIRFIVEQGEKDNKSAYESLKKVGYIISFGTDIFSEEVVQ